MSFDDTPHTDDYFVSTDKARLDQVWIIQELKKTYWGGWYTAHTLIKAIDNSLCFGLYHRGTDAKERMVGFARVVTDYATFAWVCDVIISEHHRQKGMGEFLLSIVMGHPEVRPRSCLLTTRDAHGIYERFGFRTATAMKRPGGTA